MEENTSRRRRRRNTTAPKKSTKRRSAAPPPEPESMRWHGIAFSEYQRVRHYSERTVTDREKTLALFFEWADARGVTHPHHVTLPILERYAAHVFRARKRNGMPLRAATQAGRLSSIRAFFKFLARKRVIVHNPAADLELPRIGARLPRSVFTTDEAETVIAQADTSEVLGLRDRAIMEVLYSTGLRRAEVAGLSCHDIDHERGTLLVRSGKGDKDRVVAIGDRALTWVDRYLRNARPELVVPPDDHTLFLSNAGRAIGRDYLSQLVGRYVRAANIGKQGACHAFRHSMATQMHENGADIRHIQAQLGHAELNTTAIYTRVSIRALKEAHRNTHPAESDNRDTE